MPDVALSFPAPTVALAAATASSGGGTHAAVPPPGSAAFGGVQGLDGRDGLVDAVSFCLKFGENLRGVHDGSKSPFADQAAAGTDTGCPQ